MAIAYKEIDSLVDPETQDKADSKGTQKSMAKLLFDGFLAALVIISLFIFAYRDVALDYLLPGQFVVVQADDSALSLITLDDVLLNKALIMNVALEKPESLTVVSAGDIMFEVDADRLEGASATMSLEDIYQLLTHSQNQESSGIRILEVVDKAERARMIRQTLFEANTLFKQDKLTTPRIDNAFAKYEDVLALEPGHPEALKGINNIVNRYLYFIDSVIAKRENWKVPTLIEGVVSVGRSYTDVTTIIEQYREYLSDEDIISLLPTEATSAGHWNDLQHDNTKVLQADGAIAELAVDLIIKQNHGSADSVLNEFLSAAPLQNQSFDVLMQLYLLQGKEHKAEELIYGAGNFDSAKTAEKAAHIFISREDYAGALQLLEGHKPGSVARHQTYYYLLAGLNVKLGNPQVAAELYRQLLSADIKNAYYWFGLAVVLENEQYGRASLAYRAASYLASERTLVRQYLEQNSLAYNSLAL